MRGGGCSGKASRGRWGTLKSWRSWRKGGQPGAGAMLKGGGGKFLRFLVWRIPGACADPALPSRGLGGAEGSRTQQRQA